MQGAGAEARPHPLRAGDTKGIDDVIERVHLMVEPVETVLFNVFDSAHAGQWRALRARFYQDNDEVKASTVCVSGFEKLGKSRGQGASRLRVWCGGVHAISSWCLRQQCFNTRSTLHPHPPVPTRPTPPDVAARAHRHELPQAAQRRGRL